MTTAREGVTGPSGAIALIDAFFNAPAGADIVVRLGTRADNGTTVVICTIDDFVVGMTADETDVIADAAESAIRAYPKEPNDSLSTLILGLREAAKKVRAGAPR